jgi:hypothetical protein
MSYSDIEEDFFRVGDEMNAGTAALEVHEVEPIVETRRGLWSRLFERPLRLPSETTSFVATAGGEADDDEWDWMLAVARARARHATQPGI